MDFTRAEGWRPEEGATLIGEVMSVDQGWSDQGNKYYPILTIKPEDGSDPVAVHAFHSALENELMRTRPNIGERIGIKYVGKKPHKSRPGQTVAHYVVKVDRKDAGDVWARMAGAPVQGPTVRPGGSDVPSDTSDFAQAEPTADNADDDDIPF